MNSHPPSPPIKLNQKKKSPLFHQTRNFYDRYPYPHYPLVAKPIWQEGYGCWTAFIKRLQYEIIHHSPLQNPLTAQNSLVLGCGEIQPYVMGKWEASSSHIDFVDFSPTSLRRAKLRNIGLWRSQKFILSDLDDYLQKCTKTYDHMDAFGVLHHLENPSLTIALMSQSLNPGATVRIMIYNSSSRSWIHKLQRIFRLLKLSPFTPKDVVQAQKFLSLLSTHIKTLNEDLNSMGHHTLKNKTRFVDTFMHVREARLSPTQWLHFFEKNSLTPYALFDRYQELDHITNPLWQFPNKETLQLEADLHRFSGNLEIYLTKDFNSKKDSSFKSPQRKAYPLYFKSPPHYWFSFPETKIINFKDRYKLWHQFVNYHCYTSSKPEVEALQTKYPLYTLKRLSRLGMIQPGMIKDQSLLQELYKPIHPTLEIPEGFPEKNPIHPSITQQLTEILGKKNINSRRRYLALKSSIHKL